MANETLLALIKDEKHAEFNEQAKSASEKKEPLDLTNAQLRAHDLQKFNLKRADLRGAYLRLADLRGLDLSEALLEGASLKDAKVSGTFFPKNLAAQEIQVSISLGIRLRLNP